jgi:hypothetical protein
VHRSSVSGAPTVRRRGKGRRVAILTIFRAKDVRAGQTLRASQVSVEFLAKNLGRAADYEAALKYAVDQGWLTTGLEMIRLTKAGAAEM